MKELAVVDKGADWRRLKSLVLDSVSSPITKRVYNLGLDEFFAWYGQEPRPGFTKATVAAWRVALEARGVASQNPARTPEKIASTRLDIIDTITLEKVKSIPVRRGLHDLA